VHIILTCI